MIGATVFDRSITLDGVPLPVRPMGSSDRLSAQRIQKLRWAWTPLENPSVSSSSAPRARTSRARGEPEIGRELGALEGSKTLGCDAAMLQGYL